MVKVNQLTLSTPILHQLLHIPLNLVSVISWEKKCSIYHSTQE